MRAAARGRLAILALIGLAGALPACGESPTAPPTPPPPPPRVSFQPEITPTPADSVSLQLVQFTDEDLTLALETNEVSEVFGYGVDLVYDPNFLELLETEAGDFFAGDGISVELQITENPEGRLIIGQTRVGDVAGASGSGELLRLRFRTLVTGNTTLELEDGRAFAATGDELPTDFLGGGIIVRQ